MRKDYSWLQKKPVDLSEEEAQILRWIDKKSWNDVKKDFTAQYCLDHREALEGDRNHSIRKLLKSQEFHQAQKELLSSIQSQLTLCSLVIIMTGTLFIYFLNAVLRQNYLVNFSIDAIVGSLALVLLIRNEWLKFRLTKFYTQSRDYLMIDILALVFCFLLKLMIAHMDVSLLVLLAVYYFSKRKWTHRMRELLIED